MLTAFYSIRLINIAFLQDAQGDRETYGKAHEPGAAMTIPLLVLGIASIYIGYVMKDIVIGPGTPYIEFAGGYGHSSIEAEGIGTKEKWMPVILSMTGALYAMARYPRTAQGIMKT